MESIKLTNNELFEEMQQRGFYVQKNSYKDDPIDCLIVSVEYPESVKQHVLKYNYWLNNHGDGIVDMNAPLILREV